MCTCCEIACIGTVGFERHQGLLSYKLDLSAILAARLTPVTLLLIPKQSLTASQFGVLSSCAPRYQSPSLALPVRLFEVRLLTELRITLSYFHFVSSYPGILKAPSKCSLFGCCCAVLCRCCVHMMYRRSCRVPETPDC
jgi:hypothetical protein